MFVLIHVCQDMSAAKPDDYEDPETVRVAKRARADGGGVVPHNVGGESETDYDDEKPGEVVSVTGRGFLSGYSSETACVTGWQPPGGSIVFFYQPCFLCMRSGIPCTSEYGCRSCHGCARKKQKCWFKRYTSPEGQLIDILSNHIRVLREEFLGVREGVDTAVMQNVLQHHTLGLGTEERSRRVADFLDIEPELFARYVRRQEEWEKRAKRLGHIPVDVGERQLLTLDHCREWPEDDVVDTKRRGGAKPAPGRSQRVVAKPKVVKSEKPSKPVRGGKGKSPARPKSRSSPIIVSDNEMDGGDKDGEGESREG